MKLSAAYLLLGNVDKLFTVAFLNWLIRLSPFEHGELFSRSGFRAKLSGDAKSCKKLVFVHATAPYISDIGKDDKLKKTV